jgi:hypothetical protein
MTETWRPIARTGGRYEVSDQGRVRCVRVALRGRTPGAPLVPSDPGFKGYAMVQIRRGDGSKLNLRVHTEVLTAFVGPRPDGLQGRHLDGDRTNNRLSNLVWGTPLENAADRERHGRTARGERHGNWIDGAAAAALARRKIAGLLGGTP